MSKNTGGPAYPTIYEHLYENGNKTLGTVDGMTLRDYFAGQALNGILSDSSRPHNYDIVKIPFKAYEIADAMIAEREKK